MDILLDDEIGTIASLDEQVAEVKKVEFYEEKRLISHATIRTALPRTFVITGLTAREANDLSLLISSGSLCSITVWSSQSLVLL